MSRLRYVEARSADGTFRLTMTEASTVVPKMMLLCGWPMMSNSNVGRSCGLLLLLLLPGADAGVEEDLRLWLVSGFEDLREELCFDRCLSFSSAWRLLLLLPFPASTTRGPWLSRRYVFCVESDIVGSGFAARRDKGCAIGGFQIV